MCACCLLLLSIACATCRSRLTHWAHSVCTAHTQQVRRCSHGPHTRIPLHTALSWHHHLRCPAIPFYSATCCRACGGAAASVHCWWQVLIGVKLCLKAVRCVCMVTAAGIAVCSFPFKLKDKDGQPLPHQRGVAYGAMLGACR
jgi:hypothetical protein